MGKVSEKARFTQQSAKTNAAWLKITSDQLAVRF
jgi:hypothetical protein